MFSQATPLSSLPSATELPRTFAEKVHATLTQNLFFATGIPEDRRVPVARRLVMLIAVRCNVSGVSEALELVLTMAQDSGLSLSTLVARIVHFFATKTDPQWEEKVVEAIIQLLKIVIDEEAANRPAPQSVSRRRDASPDPSPPPATTRFPTESIDRLADAMSQQSQLMMAVLQRLSADRSSNPDAVAEEIGRSRRAMAKTVTTKGARTAENFTETEVSELARWPTTYAWRKDDPYAGQIILAFRSMLATLHEYEQVGAREVVQRLAAKMASIRRFASISQASELQAATAANACDTSTISFTTLAMMEIAILGNPDVKVETLDHIRLARLTEPTTKEEVADWVSGKTAVPVAQTLVPTKARTTGESARLSSSKSQRTCRYCGAIHNGPWKDHKCGEASSKN